MSLTEEFQQAAERSQKLTKRPTNEELLDLYALFKQATEGDITGDRPQGFDFKALAKYQAWDDKKGMTKENAMEAYITLMKKLEVSYT
jgi:diazepam-binding inhibitor (GABA receptor modulating acyl-CoA-binding protein)